MQAEDTYNYNKYKGPFGLSTDANITQVYYDGGSVVGVCDSSEIVSYGSGDNLDIFETRKSRYEPFVKRFLFQNQTENYRYGPNQSMLMANQYEIPVSRQDASVAIEPILDGKIVPGKMELSQEAKEVAEKLKQAEDSPDKGKIAAIEPESGEVFLGEDEIEALEKGWAKYPDSIFYTIRIGYPSVDTLKSMNFQGEIYNKKVPNISGFIKNRNLHFSSIIPKNQTSNDFVIDTGFTGAIVIDSQFIYLIDSLSPPWQSEATLAGGVNQIVTKIMSFVWINNIRLDNIAITMMSNEFLIGMDFMNKICKRAIFDFENDKVLFED